jgi:secreted trypsin-like serine protease
MNKLLGGIILIIGLAAQAAMDYQPLIFNGYQAKEDNPVSKHTLLVIRETPDATFICTGTVIAKNMVLTASHCLGERGSRSKLSVQFGIDSNGEVIKVTKKARRREVPPPNTDYGWDDIAVLKLAKDVPAPYVPVKLLDDPRYLRTGATVILAGYGRTTQYDPTDGTDGGSGILRFVDQKILQVPWGDREFLVSIKEKGSCSGDSGGPAYIFINGELQVAGVANRIPSKYKIVKDDGSVDFPCVNEMVYSDVWAQRDWINLAIQELNK